MNQKFHNILTGFIVLSSAVQFVQPLVSPKTFAIVIAVVAAIKLVLHAVFPNDVPPTSASPSV